MNDFHMFAVTNFSWLVIESEFVLFCSLQHPPIVTGLKSFVNKPILVDFGSISLNQPAHGSIKTNERKEKLAIASNANVLGTIFNVQS